MKVYLCGPIADCTDEQCMGWRDAAKAMLPDTVDPMRRDYRGREHLYFEVVEQDKLDIMQCDALLVNFLWPSVGTSMEVLFAWEQHKIIIVVANKALVPSPWLRYHATTIVNTLEEAVCLLRKIQ